MLYNQSDVETTAAVSYIPALKAVVRSSRKPCFSKIAGALFALAATTAAFGQLNRVGDVTSNTFPAWYQDKTGVALEFCSPVNQAELLGGWCVMLQPDLPTGQAPESYPSNFAEEHFYYLAEAITTIDPASPSALPGGGRARLVIALEATVNPSLVFARTRALVTGLKAGDYVVHHPYGDIPVTVTDKNNKIFVTQDIGTNCAPGQFDCALAGGIGPFLLASNSPGGAELPGVSGPVPGKLYLADPARIGPVTGAIAPNLNQFSVTDSNGNEVLLNTAGVRGPMTDFTLNGRLLQGTIPGRLNVDRSIYTADMGSKRVDVFATVNATLPVRIPSGAKLPDTTPALVYYHGSCDTNAAGVKVAPASQTAVPMSSNGGTVWGQSKVSPADSIPDKVCVVDTTSSTAYEATVTDEVTITGANYSGNTITVTAQSSDKANNPALTATAGGVTTAFAGGSATLNVGAAPPNKVVVISAKSGRDEAHVITGECSTCPTVADTLIAQNVTAATPAGTALKINIPNSAGNLINLPATGKSALGATLTAPLDANGVSDGTILYTPPVPPPAGTVADNFTYTLSNAGLTSAPATVTVTLTAATQNPPPGQETIVVSSAQYRGDQKRWQITGTDTVSNSQILTVKNIGPAGTPKNIVLGTAVVTAGAWTLDIRNIAAGLVPAQGDRIVAVRTDVSPIITSAPLTATLTKVN